MRKVTQCLLAKFGAQFNSEVNVLVSQWYSKSYPIFDMSVSLKDINEMAIVRTLEHVIDTYGLVMADMKDIALLPALANNKCDIKVQVITLPALIERKLASFCNVEYGFWTENDVLNISDSATHITIQKGDECDEVMGMYMNGTLCDSGELFSVYFNNVELQGVFNQLNGKLLNGVQLNCAFLEKNIALRALFYRLIDSDIGFMLSQEDDVIFDMVKDMVSVGNEISESAVGNNMVFSSWGERIGVAFKKYDITDIQKAKTQEAPNKKHLSVVVNNAVLPVSSVSSATVIGNVVVEEEEELEWGQF